MPFARLPPKLRDSRRQEREVASVLGGRQTRASGARSEKGDVVAGALQVECKSTVRGSYSISIAVMDAITSAAAQSGRRGALHIRFVDPSGRTLREYAVVEPDLLQDLT